MARQRRHSSRRRRRGRFGGLYRVISILAVAVALIVACVVFFRINDVSVSGNERYSTEEIVEASGIRTGDNLIALSKSRVAGNIIARLPYVRSVAIDRLLPDRVLITVTEHTAAAAISDGSNWWYLAEQGKLLERVSDPGQVMTITGLTAQDPILSASVQVAQEEETTLSYVLALLTQLAGRGMLADCTALDCTAAASITLNYGIYQVKLPRRTDYSEYLTLLQAAISSEELPENVPGTFDLTVQDGRAYFRPDHDGE
ncbi:MAG TPA: FtsQ-type POTRA domain-containing protein [Candidatus Enterenecus stercoripullorum]|nr:FtsQ-type POTRA domain-containing protein [Candidatus Enterenecus stercoripullorum]